MEDFASLIALLREFGLWLIFAWLFINERRAHDETRFKYFEDLRDLAGINTKLARNNVNLQENAE